MTASERDAPQSGEPGSRPPAPVPQWRRRRGAAASTTTAPGALAAVRRWPVWSLPRPVLAFVLTVDAVAVVVGLGLGLSRPVGPHDLLVVAVLALGAVVHLEAARHIERLRNHESSDSGVPYIDAKSMWSFAGLVLLAPGPALALVVFTLVWWRLRVSRRPPLYRWVFSGATIVLASAVAAAVLLPLGPNALDDIDHGPRVVLTLVAAALVRWVVNHGLVVTVISLTSPDTPWRRRIGSLTDNLIGIGALALGIALAVLVETSPWLVPVLLIPVLAMHRGVLLGHFARAARTDPKTGLATLGHWRDHATRELARARRRGVGLGVLMIDLDEFKAVNDRWGHVAGDVVLRAVADTLVGEVCGDGAVGRFGGEEFVVLVTEATTPEQLLLAAERIRRRVADCRVVIDAGHGDQPRTVVAGLTVSVGAAAHPETAADLDGLVTAADTALLAAKRAGRDRVRGASRM